MLISFYKNRSGEYDEEYSNVRRKIDILCGLIISGRLSRDSALQKYDEIERDYANGKQGDLNLFRMIYKSRVERLCAQFCLKKI